MRGKISYHAGLFQHPCLGLELQTPWEGKRGHYEDRAGDLLERVLYMALIVLGVVRQQPPTRAAPISHHLFTYDTKSLSDMPVFCCNRK